MPTTGVASVLPPPRLSGNPQADAAALSNWLNEIAKILAGQQATIGSLSGDAGTIDPNDLPDPASTNLATAQQTANDAYLLASRALAWAQKFRDAGEVTIAGAATTGDFTFTTAEADTSYFAQVTPIDRTGSPATGANRVLSIAKTTTKITITLEAAPGVGATQKFDVAIFRDPTTT